MKKKTVSILCLLLALCLLAGCTGNTPAPVAGTNAPPTETTGQQPAQTQPAQTQQPTQTQEPAGTQTPAETQEPETQEPEPADDPEPAEPEPEETGIPAADLVGCWELFGAETEGEYYPAETAYPRNFLVIRGEGEALEAATYYVDPGYETEEYGWAPLTQDGEGQWSFALSHEQGRDYPVSYELISLDYGTLEVSSSFEYDDGSYGGSELFFSAAAPDNEGRTWLPMTEEEFEAVAASREEGTVGFLTHSYARPEEIHWHEVCYDGAGITSELTEELREMYENSTGWPIELDVEVIRGEDLARFAEEKTGVPYALARRPLSWDWWYDYETDTYIWQHGDTNAFGVEFTGGLRAGDWYKLWYWGSDYEHYNFSCCMELTFRLVDGKWQFYSNLPVSSAPAATLADIEFYDTRDQAEAAGADAFIDVEEWDWDEPDWCWAVVTSRFDGLRLSVDRNDYDADGMGMMYSDDVRVPTIHLDGAVLDRGEKLAVKVNRAWYPDIRVAAQKDGLWGEFWFDEENGLHLWDEEGNRYPAYILGHDDSAEGWGPDYESEEGLANFLCGNWIYYNEAGDAIEAVFTFKDYRALSIAVGERLFEIFLTYDTWEDSWVPNMLQMEKYDPEESWGGSLEMFERSLGDYLIEAEQLPNEQQLTLNQLNNGDGFLSYIFEDSGAGWQHPIVLHRYVGELPEE